MDTYRLNTTNTLTTKKRKASEDEQGEKFVKKNSFAFSNTLISLIRMDGGGRR